MTTPLASLTSLAQQINKNNNQGGYLTSLLVINSWKKSFRNVAKLRKLNIHLASICVNTPKNIRDFSLNLLVYCNVKVFNLVFNCNLRVLILNLRVFNLNIWVLNRNLRVFYLNLWVFNSNLMEVIINIKVFNLNLKVFSITSF